MIINYCYIECIKQYNSMTEFKVLTGEGNADKSYGTKYFLQLYGSDAFEQLQRYISGQDDYNVEGYELTLGSVTYPHEITQALSTIQTDSLIYRVNFELPIEKNSCMTFFRMNTTTTASNAWVPVNFCYFKQLYNDRFY